MIGSEDHILLCIVTSRMCDYQFLLTHSTEVDQTIESHPWDFPFLVTKVG